jgi:hypothetical protein
MLSLRSGGQFSQMARYPLKRELLLIVARGGGSLCVTKGQGLCGGYLTWAGMKKPQRGSAGAHYQEVLRQCQAATAITFLKMVSSTLQGFTTIGIVRNGS